MGQPFRNVRLDLDLTDTCCRCGYTDSNYRGLQNLYEQYKVSGFEVRCYLTPSRAMHLS